jgi:hypothetical protein
VSPYYFVSAPCCFCGQLFGFDPERVPSIPVDTATGKVTPEGTKLPVCGDCMAKVNRLRAAHELEPIPVLDGAYEVKEGYPP